MQIVSKDYLRTSHLCEQVLAVSPVRHHEREQEIRSYRQEGEDERRGTFEGIVKVDVGWEIDVVPQVLVVAGRVLQRRR